MRRSLHAGTRALQPAVGSALLFLSLVLCALGALGVVTDAAAAHVVSPGLCCDEIRAPAMAPAARATLAREIGSRLGARFVRLAVSWPALEPIRNEYDEEYIAALSAAVDLLRARGVKVILTVYATPRWASDSSLWDDPPFELSKGYRSMYAMRDDALPGLRLTAERLARRFRSRVFGWECWNEPNLWPYLYPQRTPQDEHFAAHLYVKMLRAFFMGVRAGDRKARVIAGATAPVGLNDRVRSSPQGFARAVRRSGGARFFDAYSHHPYTPGGTIDPQPGARPNNTTTAVTLGNISTLLRVFPRKPFYLTEYGYNTAPSSVFGGLFVSLRTQARYLRQAYAVAGRHRQIKALFWFLRQDSLSAGAPPEAGVYSGLRALNGARKPAWFAFRNL